MPEQTTTNWEPSQSDLDFNRNIIRILTDGDIWVAPAVGMFNIDKKVKTLSLQLRSPKYSREVYLRIVKSFGMVGYEVIDKSRK